jgi:putative glutamine transport system substrate-binding protein
LKAVFTALTLALCLGLAACGAATPPQVEGGASPADAGAEPADPAPTAAGSGSPQAASTPGGTGSSLAAIRERGTINIGVKYDAPPFGSLDPATNQVSGFDVDLARGIAQRLLGDPGKANLVQVTSKNRIPLLKNGQIDLFAATTTITPSRLEEINFSDVYYRAGQSLLVRNDSPIQTYRDLKGRSVCTVQGSTPEETIRRLVPGLEPTLYEGYAECFTSLKNGRVDAITTDNVILEGLRQQDPQNLKLVGGLFTFEPYGIGVRKGDEQLTQAVNDALKDMQGKGEYAKIHEQWLKAPPPADFDQWFLLDAAQAGQQFEAQSQGGGASPSPAPSPAASPSP